MINLREAAIDGLVYLIDTIDWKYWFWRGVIIIGLLNLAFAFTHLVMMDR